MPYCLGWRDWMRAALVFRTEPSMTRLSLALAALPLLAILALGLAPLLTVLIWSFWTWDPIRTGSSPTRALPAMRPSWSRAMDGALDTFLKALIGAVLCVTLAYPLAYAIHFLAGRRLALLLMAAITVPFFTSYLIRAFSWRLVLGRNGPINTFLVQTGIVDEPLDWLLFSDFAVMVGLVASYMPFAAFPLLLSMRRITPGHLAAAQDLGAGFWDSVRTIIIP